MTFYFVQLGQAFSGTADLTNTDCGDVTDVPFAGTVSGSVAAFTATYTCVMGPLTATATLEFTQATVVNGQMDGVYQMKVNGVNYDSGTFDATRQ